LSFFTAPFFVIIEQQNHLSHCPNLLYQLSTSPIRWQR